MPAYLATSLDGIPPSLIPGSVGYSFGKFNQQLPTVRMLVTSVAVTSNVATLGVQMVEGNIPAVGSLISVRGTQTASGAANVSNVALTGVTINAQTGAGTVTFALTHANIATDSSPSAAGEASVPVPVTLETLPGTAAAGLQFSVQSGSNATDNQRGITWFTQFTGSPSTVTMDLQGSDIDVDSAYTTIDASTVATGESRSLSNVNYQFLRIKAASTGGTSPTCAAGIMVR
jgi:hypothetical protein